VTHDIEVLRMWIRIVMIITSAAVTSFPVIYSFSPWRSRQLGRLLMLQAVSFAFAFNLTVLFSFWRPKDRLVIFWIDLTILTPIAISTSLLTWWVWKMNFSNGKDFPVKFTGKTYDVLKFIAQVGLPAAGTLYFTLAGLWHLPSAQEVVGSVVAVDTFLGVVLHLSTQAYNNSSDKYDGALTMTPNDDGTAIGLKGIDLEGIASKSEITLKVIPTPAELMAPPPQG